MPDQTLRVLAKQVIANANRHALFSKKAKLVVGVSGGPDSVCLLQVLSFLQKKYDLSLHAVHINYGLRGNDSDADEQLVKTLAKDLQLDVTVVPFSKQRGTSNTEQHMREFRYQAFERIRKQLGFDLIAVAHTLDDQAETMLMHLLRGSGLKGLGGIRLQRGNIIRPMLHVDRTTILACLKQNRFSYRMDQSNRDTNLTRNRIRLKLLPFLEKQFHPNVKERLAVTAHLLQQDDAFIEQISKQAYNAIVLRHEEQLAFPVERLRKIHSALLRHLFRTAVAELKGSVKDVTWKHWEEFHKIVMSDKSKLSWMRLPKVIIKKQGKFILFRTLP